MILAYLDWNVFDALSKLDENNKQIKAYVSIISLIAQKKVIAPYSNAHISDVYRGYLKNADYIKNDLSIIKRLTNNFCIVQYWGEDSARYHYRNPVDFFVSMADDTLLSRKSFAQVLTTNNDMPLIDSLWEQIKIFLKTEKLHANFKEIYHQAPIFDSIFTQSKLHMNLFSLCEDIYNFSYRIQQDYALYKDFRKYLTQVQIKFPKYAKQIKQSSMIDIPKHLSWDSLFEEMKPNYKSSNNLAFDRIIHLFTTTDLKGYQKDERFANMIDDALHTFYAAHCEYFVTNDKRCMDKAKLVYEKLGIKTIVSTPEEFVRNISDVV